MFPLQILISAERKLVIMQTGDYVIGKLKGASCEKEIQGSG